MGAAQTAAAAIRCPAGVPLEETAKGPGCRCRILGETLTREDAPKSLKAYCAGEETTQLGYVNCNVWQAARDAEARGEGEELDREIQATADETRVT